MWSRSQSLFSLCRFLRSEKSKALLAPPTSNRRERRPLFSLISFPSRYVSARDVASSLLCGERERAKGGTASRRKRERERCFRRRRRRRRRERARATAIAFVFPAPCSSSPCLSFFSQHVYASFNKPINHHPSPRGAMNEYQTF
jgi:hypothetical protein